jgi:LmbE family N-acetylglucosaminyl deacetylase
MHARDEGSQDLPAVASVLAVWAHPDDESFGLGAVLSGVADCGVRTSVLCLTHGEASTLGTGMGDLHVIRERELSSAATASVSAASASSSSVMKGCRSTD